MSHVNKDRFLATQLQHYENKLAFEIDSWDLQLALQSRQLLTIIDTRSTEAYLLEHIPGAINISHRTMDDETCKDINRDALMVTYCDGIGCNASTKGALKMANLGFKVKELIGGLDWWKRDGHQTEGQNPLGKPGRCGCC